jgi:pentatricopeptide repeat protein
MIPSACFALKRSNNASFSWHRITLIGLRTEFVRRFSSDAVKEAEEVFKDLSYPNTVAYNTLFYEYEKDHDPEKALKLLRRMRLEYEIGINKKCRPNERTYRNVLNAIIKSKRRYSPERGGPLIEAIPSPNTVTCNNILELYREKKMCQEAVCLVRRMQSDYESGKNRNSMPTKITRKILSKIVRIAHDPTLEKESEVLFEWFKKHGF